MSGSLFLILYLKVSIEKMLKNSKNTEFANIFATKKMLTNGKNTEPAAHSLSGETLQTHR